MNTGLTEEQVKAFVSVIEARVGSKEAESVGKLLTELLTKRASR
jgi:uncharacterized protein YqeY